MPPVAVFDANVLVSAMGWGGTPRRCIDAARRGVLREFRGIKIVSPAEFMEMMDREKSGLS